ncbi:MAG: hypothetical protein A3K10_10980 [Bacteroidetes bacterium RIFCSPLOWO2_12_FULL_31_6]|nr:MAG: hypothetical protein A3K10_10980 [Bacteroidetes bacterium RIFCSPLOWO2_12_FULL_31_6]
MKSIKKKFNMKISKYLLLSIVIIGLSTSCEKAYVLPEPIIPPDPNAPPISFATEILPTFTSCQGCHPGAHALDLSAANAYTQLLTAGPNAPYVDTLNPTASLLYTKINNGGSMNGYIGSQGDIAKVLTWITEGAKNN